ncbi:MAG: hypothetical protein K5644_06550 [Lachnospiraceae bacterium]|nr:hypothetical protein [Lachnospiraceae bacterium]
MKKVLTNKYNLIYLLAIMVYMVVCVFVYWEHRLDIMNTTVYAFSYKYGFMARGVLGTLLWQYDNLVPFDAISYNTIYFISKVATAIFFVMLLWFVIAVLSKCDEKRTNSAKAVLAVLILISVPMFLSSDNFGRLDVYLMIITLFCLILLIYEKAEWLIVPAVTLAALIHEGFVFMNLNIILVLLLYKCIVKTEKKVRIKYIIILALTFILPSIIFLYCEFFSHHYGTEVFDECYALAAKVSVDNLPHKEVLAHEILGFDVAGVEQEFHKWNLEDSSIFIVLFSPYIIFMTMVFRKYAKSAKTGIDKFITFIVLAGTLTLLPELILKVDYGRYVYAILFYYLAIFVTLLTLRDERIEQVFDHYKGVVIKHKWIAILGVAALFIFTPFRGYRICDIVTLLSYMIYGAPMRA